MPNREVLVLQHVESEHAGTLRDYMNLRGIKFRPVKLYAGEGLPDDVSHFRAVLIMGGPMNVYEEDKYVFLKPEDEFIKKIIAGDVPCLGICLGAQLIAKAMAARVTKAKAPEIGWGDIRFTEEGKRDPLFSTVNAPELRVLQWHEDTFELPRHAIHLAKSALVDNQAYRFGDKIYGLQFHVEVDEPMLKDWFKKSADREAILKEYGTYRQKLSEITQLIYKNFLML